MDAVELRVVARLVREMRFTGVESFQEYHEACDANEVLDTLMSLEGLDIFADDYAAANRITAEADRQLRASRN